MKDSNNFSSNSLINKSDNDLIESLISNDTRINTYNNKIELIQKLSDGNIIVITRKTVKNFNSSSQNKKKKITTINIIEESNLSDIEGENLGNTKNDIMESNDEILNKNIPETKVLTLKKKRRTKAKIKEITKGEKNGKRRNTRSKKLKNKFDFRSDLNKNKIGSNADVSNNFNNLFTELKPLQESDMFETPPDSVKQYDAHSNVDSVNENQKVRVTRSRINNNRNNLYFLSQLNDVKNLCSLRLRCTENKAFSNK